MNCSEERLGSNNVLPVASRTSRVNRRVVLFFAPPPSRGYPCAPCRVLPARVAILGLSGNLRRGRCRRRGLAGEQSCLAHVWGYTACGLTALTSAAFETSSAYKWVRHDIRVKTWPTSGKTRLKSRRLLIESGLTLAESGRRQVKHAQYWPKPANTWFILAEIAQI